MYTFLTRPHPPHNSAIIALDTFHQSTLTTMNYEVIRDAERGELGNINRKISPPPPLYLPPKPPRAPENALFLKILYLKDAIITSNPLP